MTLVNLTAGGSSICDTDSRDWVLADGSGAALAPGQAVDRHAVGGQAKILLVRLPSEALIAVAPSSHSWPTTNKHVSLHDFQMYMTTVMPLSKKALLHFR